MLINYFKIACRNIFRNKIYAPINIISISIGLAAFWLIALYVGDEFSYDRSLPNSNRIYRVAQHASWEGGKFDLALTSPPFAPEMKATFPEIEEVTRIDLEGGGLIKHENKLLKIGDIIFADSNFFNVFEYEFIYGNPKTALDKPGSIVITESLAEKIFGDKSVALNQSIILNDSHTLITGIIKDLPQNTHLQFSGIRLGSQTFNSMEWQNIYLYTYLKLVKGANLQGLQQKIPKFAAASIQKELKVTEYKIELQPLSSIHLHSNLNYEIGSNGSISRVYMFMAIALLILAMAIINYVNLSTARASVRVKEVGIRKVVGSGRKNLLGLFLAESILTTFIATAFAFFLVYASIPFMDHFTGRHLAIWSFGIPLTLVVLFVFSLFTGFVSGSYPAFFLSRFKTIPALKGQLGNMQGNIFFRKSLVVFQFMITVIIITGAFVIYNQMQYALQKDLGFNKEQTISFHIDDMKVRSQIASLKSGLLKSPSIEGVAVAGNQIGNNYLGGHSFSFEQNGVISDQKQMAQELQADEDFIKTMDIKLLQGRNFSKDRITDQNSGILINETLMKTLGWKNAINKKVEFNRNENSKTEQRIVIGVIKDFHTYSLQHKIEPLVIMMPQSDESKDNLYVRIAKGKTAAGLAYIKKVYAGFDNNQLEEIHFLNENFAKQYDAEQKQEQVTMLFSVLAIIIACLGLFGLTTFTAAQRIKEIGIRKVLGASVGSVIVMLEKDFIRLVFIAVILALPVAWWVMNKWLQDFAYRINISWWMLLTAGVIALVIAMVTVSFQAIKAAVANPVKSLRSE